MRSTRARRTSGMLSNSRTFLADSELASMYLPSIHKEPLLQAPCSDLCIAIHLAVSRRYTCGTRFQTHPMPRRPFPCNQSPPCRFLPFQPARPPRAHHFGSRVVHIQLGGHIYVGMDVVIDACAPHVMGITRLTHPLSTSAHPRPRASQVVTLAGLS